MEHTNPGAAAQALRDLSQTETAAFGVQPTTPMHALPTESSKKATG